MNYNEMLEVAHKEYPRKEKYPNEYYDGKHDCSENEMVIYCDSVTDIVRCKMCGYERKRPCNF